MSTGISRSARSKRTYLLVRTLERKELLYASHGLLPFEYLGLNFIDNAEPGMRKVLARMLCTGQIPLVFCVSTFPENSPRRRGRDSSFFDASSQTPTTSSILDICPRFFFGLACGGGGLGGLSLSSHQVVEIYHKQVVKENEAAARDLRDALVRRRASHSAFTVGVTKVKCMMCWG